MIGLGLGLLVRGGASEGDIMNINRQDSNLYYMQDGMEPGAGAAIIAARLYIMPITFGNSFTINRIVFDNTAAVVGNARCGLYRNYIGPKGPQAGDKLAESAEHDTNVVEVKETTFTAFRPPVGLCWLAFQASAAANVRTATPRISPLGLTTPAPGNIVRVMYVTAGPAYGALPASLAGEDFTSSAGAAPCVYVRPGT